MKKIFFFILFFFPFSIFANSGDTLEVPEFKIQFQSPSYILDKEMELEEYTCDGSKEECKINMKLLEEDESDISSKFLCSIDLGFDSSESEKCNPNTIIFPEGTWNIILQVFEKENLENKKEKSITIINRLEEAIIIEEPVVEEETVLEIPDPIIEVQSGLEYSGEGNIWNMVSETGRTNFDASEIFTENYIESNYTCLWSFGGGTFSTEGTDTKCNPGYVYYGEGEFQVTLQIQDKNDTLHFKETHIIINNRTEIEIQDKEEVKEITIEKETIYRELIVQSGLDSNNNCQDEKCKINLMYDGKFSDTCTWDFGNLEFKESYMSTCNPSYIYAHPGSYTISLLVLNEDGEEVFVRDISIVNTYSGNVEKKEDVKKELVYNEYEYKFNKLVLRDIKISSILVNPKGYDTSEYIELENTGKYLLNLRGLQIDDRENTGSSIYTIERDLFLEGGGKVKLYKSETKLSLDNSGDEVRLFCESRKGDVFSWEGEVPEEYILTHENKVGMNSEVEVVEIVDGDTIKVKMLDGTTQTIRLIGVDAPEKNHPHKEKEIFSEESYEFTKKVLLGRNVRLVQPRDNFMDAYKRYLGFIYLKKKDGGEILFNEILVQMGYAKAYLKYKFEFIEEIEQAEKYAKENNLGIWKGKEEEGKKDTEEVQKNIKKIPFSKNIKKQKRSLRIDGKTLPNKEVSIYIGGTIYKAQSDDTGKYATNITSLTPGEYEVSFMVGNEAIEKTKELILENSYVQEVESQNIKKVSTQEIEVKIETESREKDDENILIVEKKEEIKKETQNMSLYYLVLFFIGTGGGICILKKRKLL